MTATWVTIRYLAIHAFVAYCMLTHGGLVENPEPMKFLAAFVVWAWALWELLVGNISEQLYNKPEVAEKLKSYKFFYKAPLWHTTQAVDLAIVGVAAAGGNFILASILMVAWVLIVSKQSKFREKMGWK